jgi:hypothetical protein
MGRVESGKIIEVSLSAAANVRIMTEENFIKFKNKHVHEFIGGYVKYTPYTAKITHTDNWYVVVDLGGREGDVQAAVSMYSKARKVKVTAFS